MADDYLELKNWLDETRDEPLEGMSAFFERRLDGYEEHMSVWSGHYKWLASLLPEGIHSLLDLGCGTGLELDEIFARFPTLDVTGVDLSSQMLAKLRAKHPEKSMTLIQSDYFVCDLGENRYDCAVSFETLHHFTAERKTELFKKIRSSLKSGGVYLECDYTAVTPEIERLAFDECDRRRRRDKIPEGVFVHFDTPLTAEHELGAIKAAGFTSVELVGFLDGDNHTAMIRAIK